MTIEKDNYVSGFEVVGVSTIRPMTGWVDRCRVSDDGHLEVDIQCDDGYGGARGSTLLEKYGAIDILSSKKRP